MDKDYLRSDRFGELMRQLLEQRTRIVDQQLGDRDRHRITVTSGSIPSTWTASSSTSWTTETYSASLGSIAVREKGQDDEFDAAVSYLKTLVNIDESRIVGILATITAMTGRGILRSNPSEMFRIDNSAVSDIVVAIATIDDILLSDARALISVLFDRWGISSLSPTDKRDIGGRSIHLIQRQIDRVRIARDLILGGIKRRETMRNR